MGLSPTLPSGRGLVILAIFSSVFLTAYFAQLDTTYVGGVPNFQPAQVTVRVSMSKPAYEVGETVRIMVFVSASCDAIVTIFAPDGRQKVFDLGRLTAGAYVLTDRAELPLGRRIVNLQATCESPGAVSGTATATTFFEVIEPVTITITITSTTTLLSRSVETSGTTLIRSLTETTTSVSTSTAGIIGGLDASWSPAVLVTAGIVGFIVGVILIPLYIGGLIHLPASRPRPTPPSGEPAPPTGGGTPVDPSGGSTPPSGGGPTPPSGGGSGGGPPPPPPPQPPDPNYYCCKLVSPTTYCGRNLVTVLWVDVCTGCYRRPSHCTC